MLLKVGDTAIDFDLTLDSGVRVNLFDRIAKNPPLFLIFYKYNCPTCQFTFQYLPRISGQVGLENYLAVAQDTSQEALQFRSKYGVKFDIACDVHPYLVSQKYGIDFVPTAFVIESDKTISAVAEGFDKKVVEGFAVRIALTKKIQNFTAFQPHEQVPLLKPG